MNNNQRPNIENSMPLFEDDSQVLKENNPMNQPAQQMQQPQMQMPQMMQPQTAQQPQMQMNPQMQANPQVQMQSPPRVNPQPQMATPGMQMQTPSQPRNAIRVHGKKKRRFSSKSMMPLLEKKAEQIAKAIMESNALDSVDVPQTQGQMPGATMPLISGYDMPAVAAPNYLLISKRNGELFELSGEMKIGCDPSFADIVIPNNTVSKKHATLTVKGPVLLLEDVGSKNGTHLNGKRIPKGFSIEVETGSTIIFSNEEYYIDMQ